MTDPVTPLPPQAATKSATLVDLSHRKTDLETVTVHGPWTVTLRPISTMIELLAEQRSMTAWREKSMDDLFEHYRFDGLEAFERDEHGEAILPSATRIELQRITLLIEKAVGLVAGWEGVNADCTRENVVQAMADPAFAAQIRLAVWTSPFAQVVAEGNASGPSSAGTPAAAADTAGDAA